MSQTNIVFKVKDAEADSKEASVPFFVPNGDTLAHYTDYMTAAAEVLDNVTGSQIMSAQLVLDLALPGGIKTAPVAASLNERGGLWVMTTSGPYGDSFRVPAILVSIMPGDDFAINAGAPDVFSNFLISGDGIVITKTRNNFDFLARVKGKKSFRRK